MDVRTLVRADFADLEEYAPVKPIEVLARELGLAPDEIVKLDANENLYGPHPAVREAAARAPFHIYPDPYHTALRQALAEWLDVRAEQIVAGAGADDILDIVIRLAWPDAVVTAPPTFGMYSFLARVNRARVVEVPRLEGWELDVAGIASAVRQGATLIFLASPNNPTGNLASVEEVERLCALDALVVVDEAYAEFAGTTFVPLIAEHPNLVVVRTFSKWAGLAGLRIGYGVANEELARRMMAIKQPYNVSVAAEAAALAALAHRDDLMDTVRATVLERERLESELARFPWLRPHHSAANFVLCGVEGRSARHVADALRRRGVLVRYYDRPELRNYIRISAGRPQDTDRLLAALREVEEE